MDMADIGADPHYAARDAIVDRRRHTDAGPDRQAQSATPGVLRWPGRGLDADGDPIRRNGWG